MSFLKNILSQMKNNKKITLVAIGLIVIIVIVLIFLFFSRGPSETYLFIQDDWSKEETTEISASHLLDQIGWNKFYDKGDSISAQRYLTLSLINEKKTDSTYDNFNKGIKDKTSVEGIGEDGEVILEIFDVFEIGNVVSISTGTSHTCAVSDAGYTYCWGRGNHGQLGNNNREDSLTPVRVHSGKAEPIDSDGGYLANIKSVSVGGDHTCAVSRVGNIYCWGYGEYGQNGNNTNSNESLPVRVHEGEALSVDSDGGYLTNIKNVSGGSDHTCAVSSANNVYCWGEGANGRLGNNEEALHFIPVRVKGGNAITNDTVDGYLTNIRNVSSGSDHTCVVSNSNNVYCWGHKERLGNEATEDVFIPSRILAGEAPVSDRAGTNLSNIRNVSAGHLHTCAVSNSGNAYCWGYGQYGQLGNNATSNERAPVLVQVNDRETPRSDYSRRNQLYYFSNAKDISAGHLHTCAVSNSNNVYCWGYGQFGQIGNNNTSNRSMPVRVHAGEAVYADKDNTFLSNIDVISPGYRQTCAISRASHAYCWGHGYHGQLGNNNKRNYHTPVRPRKLDFRLYFVVAKYNFEGNFISREIDTGQNNIRFTNLEFLTTKSREVDVKFKIRTAKTEDGLYDADWYGPNSMDDYYNATGLKINSIHDGDRWVQYRVFLETTNDSFTPIVRSVNVGYEFYPASDFLISSPYNTGKTPTYLNNIKWSGDVPEGSFIKFQIRVASDDKGKPGEWTSWVGPDKTEESFFQGESVEMKDSLNGIFNERSTRWIQYKVLLGSIEGRITPVLKKVEITYMQ